MAETSTLTRNIIFSSSPKFQIQNPQSTTTTTPKFNPIKTKKKSQIYLARRAPMAAIYCCRECGANLNLQPADLFPADFYFEAGNKNTLSFAAADASKLRFEKEDKIRPFFETLNYWGIQRRRVKIKCSSCAKLLGYVYDDGPPLTTGIGQFGFGPSQAIPRNPRYRFKNKALAVNSQT